jgi:hypothetical protein
MAQRYRKVKINGRSVSEHRWVWEQAYGPIPLGYIVHHRNNDKLDNRLVNLELLTHAEHSRHHNDKHPRVKTCEACGAEYEPPATKRSRSKTCSRPCALELMRRAAIRREAERRSA